MLENMDQVEAFFYNRKKYGIKPGLDRIKKLLNKLDNPQNKIKAIHIAGTNGKGSTLNYIKSALIANQYKVGVFTSPSMTGLTGHLFVNDQMIEEDFFINIMNTILPSIQQMDEQGFHVTEFEIITVVAFIYFSKIADISLIETGMGGLEDATNCVNPMISIITSVSLDHTTYLGNKIEQIATHKAGIIKSNIPVVIGKMQSSVETIILQETRSKNAPLFKLGDEFTYSNIEVKQEGENFIWHDEETNLHVILKMSGRHQVENCSVALKAVNMLREQGYSIKWDAVQTALRLASIPGRFEPIYNDPTIILDGAHNPAGIETFLNTISSHYQYAEKHLLFGVFKDKDLDQMIGQCIPHFKSITLTSFEHERSAGMDELTKYSTRENIQVVNDWEEQLSNILNHSTDPNSVYFITGSLNFISQVREKMRRDDYLR